MKSNYILIFVPCFLFTRAFTQSIPLFESKEPVILRATGSVKSIKKKSNDSTFVTGKFEYEQNKDQWVEVPVQARVRGNLRLNNCYFPPLKLKFGKKDVATTLFAGNKTLKLVLPCRNSSSKNELILKEYMCYQFYQVLSPNFFRTRLAKLSLTEVSRKKERKFDLLTFFIEDNSVVARRSGGKIVETKGISPAMFDEKASIRNDFFQYMIGNADWSAVFQHNSNTMFMNGKYVPLSYDFDMSGFVNADYARENPPTLGTGDPRDRVYRGFCKSRPAMDEVRKEFLAKESEVKSIIDSEASYFDKYTLREMHGFIDEFFDILRNETSFQEKIVSQCRTK